MKFLFPILKKKSHPSRAGFSLIEVAFSLAILTFVLTSVMGLFFVGIRTDHDSAETVRASNLMAQLVSMRRANWNDLLSGTPSPAPCLLPPFTTIGASPFSGGVVAAAPPSIYVMQDGTKATRSSTADFRLSYSINPPANQSVPGLYHIWVVLSWPPVTPLATAAGKYEGVIDYYH